MIIDLTKEHKIRSLRDKKLESIDLRNYKTIINGKELFIKDLDKKGLHAELIALEILDFLNIPRVKAGLGIIKGKRYFITYAAYENPQEFISGETLLDKFYRSSIYYMQDNPDFYGDPDWSIEDLNSFHTIWQAIEWYTQKYNITNSSSEEILSALIKQFLFNYISGLEDMHTNNWALLHQNNTLSVYPRFDNDNLERYFPDTEIRWSDTLTVYYRNSHQNIDGILKDFLSYSDNQYLNIALEMIDILLTIGMDNIINITEKKWNISIEEKEEFAKRYTDRLMYICELIDSIKNKDSKITVHR